MNVWLDDIRDPREVERLSLDNDLGPDEEEGRRLVLWMAEFEIWPDGPISVHSSNPVARDYMYGMLKRYSLCDTL